MRWLRHELSLSSIAAVEVVPLAISVACFGYGGTLWAGREYAAANALFGVGSLMALLSLLWPVYAWWLLSHREKSQTEDRVVVDVTADYLTGFFRNHMGIEAQRLVQPFIGKWMMVSGEVKDVSFDLDVGVITFNLPADPKPFMFFKRNWHDRLSLLKRGQQVKVIGRISRVNDYAVHLSDCELMTEPVVRTMDTSGAQAGAPQ